MADAQLATLSNHIMELQQLQEEDRLLGEMEADKLEQAKYFTGLREETRKEIADKEATIKALTAQRFGLLSASPSTSTSTSQQADTTDDESPSERDDSDDEDYRVGCSRKPRAGKKRGRRGRASGWHHTEESKAKMSAAKKAGWARKRAALLLDLAGATEPPSPTGYNTGLPTGSTPTSATPTDVETTA